MHLCISTLRWWEFPAAQRYTDRRESALYLEPPPCISKYFCTKRKPFLCSPTLAINSYRWLFLESLVIYIFNLKTVWEVCNIISSGIEYANDHTICHVFSKIQIPVRCNQDSRYPSQVLFHRPVSTGLFSVFHCTTLHSELQVSWN